MSTPSDERTALEEAIEAPFKSTSSVDRLTTALRRTGGLRPPALVGCSVTRNGDKIYVFGGREAFTKTMKAELWVLDLDSLVWDKAWEGSEVRGRYFHGSATWGTKLVFFGGQAFLEVEGEGVMETLDEVIIWDTETSSWSRSSVSTAEGIAAPSPRYATLTHIFQDRLHIFGGQDAANNYLRDMATLDLLNMKWTAHTGYAKRAGSYRSCLCGNDMKVERELDGRTLSVKRDPGEMEAWIFSNANFDEPKRSIDLITLSAPGPDSQLVADDLSAFNTSSLQLPVGLRFPSSIQVGNHLVVSGLHLKTPHEGSYAIWTLNTEDREDMRWTEIDVGGVLGEGSWNRLIGGNDQVVILGDRERSAARDYQLRVTNFSYVAILDLEAYGIYQPPARLLPPSAQDFALKILNATHLADFEVHSIDGQVFPCSRKLLRERWPWLKRELESFSEASQSLTKARSRSFEQVTVDTIVEEEEEEEASGLVVPAVSTPSTASSFTRFKSTLHVSPRRLDLPLAGAVVANLIRYFYTLDLPIPASDEPVKIIGSLLIFADSEKLPHLKLLAKHVLHTLLEDDSSSAPQIYESAMLALCPTLQIRALDALLNMKRPAACPPLPLLPSPTRSKNISPPLVSIPEHSPPPSPHATSIFSAPPTTSPSSTANSPTSPHDGNSITSSILTNGSTVLTSPSLYSPEQVVHSHFSTPSTQQSISRSTSSSSLSQQTTINLEPRDPAKRKMSTPDDLAIAWKSFGMEETEMEETLDLSEAYGGEAEEEEDEDEDDLDMPVIRSSNKLAKMFGEDYPSRPAPSPTEYLAAGRRGSADGPPKKLVKPKSSKGIMKGFRFGTRGGEKRRDSALPSPSLSVASGGSETDPRGLFTRKSSSASLATNSSSGGQSPIQYSSPPQLQSPILPQARRFSPTSPADRQPYPTYPEPTTPPSSSPNASYRISHTPPGSPLIFQSNGTGNGSPARTIRPRTSSIPLSGI